MGTMAQQCCACYAVSSVNTSINRGPIDKTGTVQQQDLLAELIERSPFTRELSKIDNTPSLL
jgi:hypothetical protein